MEFVQVIWEPCIQRKQNRTIILDARRKTNLKLTPKEVFRKSVSHIPVAVAHEAKAEGNTSPGLSK